MNPLDFISGIFDPVAKLVDDIHYSGEEKANAQQVLLNMKANLTLKMLEYETKLMENQASVIKAEAQSSGFLTRSWRPLVMLMFAGMLLSYWFGYSPENVTDEMIDKLFTVINVGLGGYVIGRSVEKAAPSLVGLFSKK